MVIGMLLAGGTGERVGGEIPKQFVMVDGKPIIWYPLEIMESHREIEAVEVVCVQSYIDVVWNIVREAGLKKVRWICTGGATCQESTRNGIRNLKGIMKPDDIILIHMSSYPLAPTEIMSECIVSARKNGSGCTAQEIYGLPFFTNDKNTSTRQMDRDGMMLCTMPYAFRYGECAALYEKAYAENRGVLGNVYTNTLYCDYGKRIFFTKDVKSNIKITTPEDIKLMEVYLQWLKESDSASVINE